MFKMLTLKKVLAQMKANNCLNLNFKNSILKNE